MQTLCLLSLLTHFLSFILLLLFERVSQIHQFIHGFHLHVETDACVSLAAVPQSITRWQIYNNIKTEMVQFLKCKDSQLFQQVVISNRPCVKIMAHYLPLWVSVLTCLFRCFRYIPQALQKASSSRPKRRDTVLLCISDLRTQSVSGKSTNLGYLWSPYGNQPHQSSLQVPEEEMADPLIGQSLLDQETSQGIVQVHLVLQHLQTRQQAAQFDLQVKNKIQIVFSENSFFDLYFLVKLQKTTE